MLETWCSGAAPMSRVDPGRHPKINWWCGKYKFINTPRRGYFCRFDPEITRKTKCDPFQVAYASMQDKWSQYQFGNMVQAERQRAPVVFVVVAVRQYLPLCVGLRCELLIEWYSFGRSKSVLIPEAVYWLRRVNTCNFIYTHFSWHEFVLFFFYSFIIYYQNHKPALMAILMVDRLQWYFMSFYAVATILSCENEANFTINMPYITSSMSCGLEVAAGTNGAMIDCQECKNNRYLFVWFWWIFRCVIHYYTHETFS